MIDDRNASAKSVMVAINKVIKEQFDAEAFVLHADVAHERIGLERYVEVPATVTHPRKVTVNPHANFVLRAACRREVVEANIRVVKIMYQPLLVQSNG